MYSERLPYSGVFLFYVISLLASIYIDKDKINMKAHIIFLLAGITWLATMPCPYIEIIMQASSLYSLLFYSIYMSLGFVIGTLGLFYNNNRILSIIFKKEIKVVSPIAWIVSFIFISSLWVAFFIYVGLTVYGFSDGPG